MKRTIFFPLERFPTWLPWMILLAGAIYLMHSQVNRELVFYPLYFGNNTVIEQARLRSAITPYQPDAIAIPGGNSWI